MNHTTTFAKMKKKQLLATTQWPLEPSGPSRFLEASPEEDDLHLDRQRHLPYTCLVNTRKIEPEGLEWSSHHQLRVHNSSQLYPTQGDLSPRSWTSALGSTAMSHPVIFSSSRGPRTSRLRSRTSSFFRLPSSSSSSFLVLLLLYVILSPSLLLGLAQASSLSPHSSQPYSVAPAGCEWRHRSAVSHFFAHLSEPSDGQSPPSGGPSSPSTPTSDQLLSCSLKTLNEGVNFALLPSERTTSLLLSCSDTLFESTLPPRPFERLHYLRELHLERCKLGDLPADTFTGLRELRQLSLRTHNGDWASELSLRLPPGLFAPLHRLEALDLSENGLSSLPPHLACPLGRLGFLNVSANVIGDVASFGFSAKTFESASLSPSSPTGSECRRLEAITHLDASFNRIKVLTDRGFGRLTRLSILTLRHNSIVRAEETSLAGLGELSRLDLSNNALVALPARFFQSVKGSLAELYLQNNSMSVIPPGLFSGLGQLTVLDLSHNEVTSHWIGPATFADAARLLSLDLSYNKLTRVDANAFRALYTLQSLSLQHNLIESLAENAFSANRNLHTLSLSGNRLSALDAASFAGLEVLNALALDGNRLLHIHAASFANISGLMELNLGSNRLESVPVALTPLHGLRSLDLSGNRIREIGNASYRGLEQLYGLNLEGNLIGNLTRGDFLNLPNLRVLNLAFNRISTIEANTFDDILDLHALRLDSNSLESVNLFANLRDLLMLNISANRIKDFDYAMIPMGLQWLDLHENRVEKLGNFYSIEGEVKLRTLDASGNRLVEIEDNSLPNSIELLLLNRNAIRTVAPHVFATKPNLTRVDLSENRLTSLTLDSLRMPATADRRTMPEFSIAGNPFLCDCTMEWLQREPATLATMAPTAARGPFGRSPGLSASAGLNLTRPYAYPRIVDVQSVQCRLPFGRFASGAVPSSGSHQILQQGGVSGAMVPLSSVRPSQFLCSYRSHCFTLCHCCDFDACDCEMSCPDNCTCYQDNAWDTNIVDCGVKGHTVVPSRIPMDVTDLYLDGNVISELSPHTFIGRKNLLRLHLNSSHIHAINNRTFNGLRSLQTLNLADNELDTLYGYEFERLEYLRELYLQNNRLTTIGNRTFSALKSLTLLRLDGNRLIEFELWSGLDLNVHLAHLYIGSNDWSCDCYFMGHLIDWLPERAAIIRDLPSLHCQYNETYVLPLAGFASNSIDMQAARENITTACNHYAKRESIADKVSTNGESTATGASGGKFLSPVLVLIALSTAGILFLLVCLVTAALYRHELSVWLFARTGWRLGGASPGKAGGRRRKGRGGGDYAGDEHDERLFDAFISYSKKDEQFVTQTLSPELEYGSTPLRLCLCYRDLPIATGYVSEAIIEAISSSKRSILVISESFLRGEWLNAEFKTALQESLNRRNRHKMILIFVGPVAAKDLDPDIRMWLKTTGNTCLQWGEKMFWEKLRYALPDIGPPNGSSGTSSSSGSTASSSYGRKGQTLGKTGTLPALTSLNSHSPLAPSRHVIDSYGHHGHLQHLPPSSQLSAHHPLLAHPGTLHHHHPTLGRGGQQHPSYYASAQPLYSPASVHSQQSTYAYPTYNPPGPGSYNHHPQQQHHMTLGPPSHQSTPPPLPPAHPLHSTLHLQHHPSNSYLGGGSHSASTTATSLESSMGGGGGQHHPLSHHQMGGGGHQRGGPNSSSNESSLMTNLGSGATTITTNSSDSDRSGGGGGGGGAQMPFVPSASSTTAVAVHI